MAKRSTEGTEKRPWTELDNRRQGYPFGLRLTELQKAQLDYIAEHGGVRSAHSWVLKILGPALEEEAERLFKTHGAGGQDG